MTLLNFPKWLNAWLYDHRATLMFRGATVLYFRVRGQDLIVARDAKTDAWRPFAPLTDRTDGGAERRALNARYSNRRPAEVEKQI